MTRLARVLAIAALFCGVVSLSAPRLLPRKQMGVQHPSLVKGAISKGVGDGVRSKAWVDFDQILTGRGGPPWSNPAWETKCELHLGTWVRNGKIICDEFAAIPPCPEMKLSDLASPEFLATIHKSPILRTRRNGKLESDKPDLILAETGSFAVQTSHCSAPLREAAAAFFNEQAREYISSNRYNNDVSGLQGLLGKQMQEIINGQCTDAACPRLVAFPVASPPAIAVKPIWQVVDSNHQFIFVPPLKGDGTLDPGPDGSLGEIGLWKKVNIKLTKTPPCSGPGVLNLSCFYRLYITQPYGAAIGATLGNIPNGATPPPQTGNYFLVLVGMHIAISDRKSWRWATFWWNPNRPRSEIIEQQKALNRVAPAQEGFFSMDTTVVGLPVVDEPVPYCYNPYLEGHFSGGTRSNCLFCHAHASFSPYSFDPNNSGLIQDQMQAFPQANESDPAHVKFSTELPTGFVWSLADHANAVNGTLQLHVVNTFGASNTKLRK